VIGGGDYSEDRIVPDAVRAFVNKKPLMLRRPQATRPWQHVLESVSGYLALGQRLLSSGDKAKLLNFNFGPDFEAERSVQELMDCWLATWPDAMEVQSEPQPAYGEATRLSLDHSLAVQELGWKPVWNFQQTVARTAAWYRECHERQADATGMLDFTFEQINAYGRNDIITISHGTNRLLSLLRLHESGKGHRPWSSAARQQPAASRESQPAGASLPAGCVGVHAVLAHADHAHRAASDLVQRVRVFLLIL
jgi:hypothetical protein